MGLPSEHDPSNDHRAAGQGRGDTPHVAAAAVPHGTAVSWAARNAPCATAALVLQQAVVQPPLPEVCVRRQVLNSGLNYLLQFPAPTGAYVQVTALLHLVTSS